VVAPALISDLLHLDRRRIRDRERYGREEGGLSNYIVKPFNAATLKTKMEAVFPEAAE
jgi:hypothetical protein